MGCFLKGNLITVAVSLPLADAGHQRKVQNDYKKVPPPQPLVAAWEIGFGTSLNATAAKASPSLQNDALFLAKQLRVF